MTTTRRVGGGGSTGFGGDALGVTPLAKGPLGAGKRFLVRHVADDGENRVVGAEPRLVERDEIVAGDAADRLRRPGVGPAVRMKAVNQAVEHHPGDVVRILVADLEPRKNLLPLPLELLGRERRVSRQIGHHVEPECEAVLHHDGVDERQIAARPGADQPANRIDRRGNLLGVFRRRALIEQRGDERRHAGLVGGVLRAAGANDQPEAHGRLLVMRDGNHLEPVGERPYLVRRKLHVTRRERPWRPLLWPIRDLRPCR